MGLGFEWCYSTLLEFPGRTNLAEITAMTQRNAHLTHLAGSRFVFDINTVFAPNKIMFQSINEIKQSGSEFKHGKRPRASRISVQIDMAPRTKRDAPLIRRQKRNRTDLCKTAERLP